MVKNINAIELSASCWDRRCIVAERNKNMREALLLAGINEINLNGVHNFSIRRVAEACGVSCAAPYKHFKDKKEFIYAIIDYVNKKWRVRQQEVISKCGNTFREQITAICVEYVRFLMEEPYYRSILLLKNDEYDNIYHKAQGELNSTSQQLQYNFFTNTTMDKVTQMRKLHVCRALLFGTVFLIDAGEIPFTEESLENLRYFIDREFDLP